MKHIIENSVEKGGMLFMIIFFPSFKLLNIFVNWWVVSECMIGAGIETGSGEGR